MPADLQHTHGRIKRLIISNVAEAFAKILGDIRSAAERECRIANEHNLSDRAFFWESNNKVIVTPYPISRELMKHNTETTGFSNVTNLSPSKVEISLCEAIRRDQRLRRTLIDIIEANPGIELSAYSSTKQFGALAEDLRQVTSRFVIREVPVPGAHWVTTYLDSKAGFRSEMTKLCGELKDVLIPDGFICRDQQEAIEVASWFYSARRSCVIKANFGESGWGLIMLKRGSFGSPTEISEAMKREFSSNSIWRYTPIIVEEYIVPSVRVAGGSPSTEVFVTSAGATVTYTCGQMLSSDGASRGL